MANAEISINRNVMDIWCYDYGDTIHSQGMDR